MHTMQRRGDGMAHWLMMLMCSSSVCTVRDQGKSLVHLSAAAETSVCAGQSAGLSIRSLQAISDGSTADIDVRLAGLYGTEAGKQRCGEDDS